MNKNTKVLIGTPSYSGKIDIYYVDSLIHTLPLAASNGFEIFPLFICYDALIQRARNDIFKAAYELNVDALFFIDDDIGWSPKNFFKILNSEKDFIGAAYRKKDDQEMYVLKALENKDNSINLDIDNDGLLEVSGLGFGFTKLSKKVIHYLWENSEKYMSEKGESRMISEVQCKGELISEDITICNKWRNNTNNKIYLDTTITCSHTGTKNYTGDVGNYLRRISNNKVNNIAKYFQENNDDNNFKVLV